MIGQYENDHNYGNNNPAADNPPLSEVHPLCTSDNTKNKPFSPRFDSIVFTWIKLPLNPEVRKALDDWLVDRKDRFLDSEDSAFFLNRKGQRLSQRSIDLLLRKIGQETNVVLSAHTLRHTCLTNLVRKGTELFSSRFGSSYLGDRRPTMG